MTEFDTIVLGASGYVGGECLRLVGGHPGLKLAGAVSESRAGAPIAEAFPHLQSSFAERFHSPEDIPAILERTRGTVGVLSAGSHGASAALVLELLRSAAKKGVDVRVVDLSADFRFAEASGYEAVYGKTHGAPSLLSAFVCGVPEHIGGTPLHAGHPGCFTTSVLLAIVPLLKLGIVEPDLYVVGVTGSTGSGREPKETTHHPARRSNLFAYQPLVHRHVPEMRSLAEKAAGVRPKIHFVPHSGPFARGIHTTVQGRLRASLDAAAIRSEIASFYGACPLVRVVAGAPRIKDVAGSSYAHLGVAADGETVAVFSVIDNLLKGAAGGGVQWLNRLLGLSETAGLTQPGPGWI
ncbi:MAG: N-acetyl-gamma-glutamyl-phosphate reductase [Vicinamibacteria bacterium]